MPSKKLEILRLRFLLFFIFIIRSSPLHIHQILVFYCAQTILRTLHESQIWRVILNKKPPNLFYIVLVFPHLSQFPLISYCFNFAEHLKMFQLHQTESLS
jgi:ABC-type arginine/histidine transport system permease subunit